MASIVYEGMVAGEGDLFSGLKFFIMQRVPLRETWRDAVVNNGGQVVRIDKQADFVIADHARKDCPTGSISWTFIDKSVTRGRLEDIENHRAGPTIRSVKEVGSAQPARSGRTPFTAQDDRDVTIWAIKAERQGISTKGNETWKQLEAINPRHTYQSWRDRWVKHLINRPLPEFTEEDMSTVGNPEGSRYSNHPPPARRLRFPSLDEEVMEIDPPPSIKQEPEKQPSSSVSRSRSTITKPKPSASTSTPKPPANKPKNPPTAAKSTPMLPLVRKSTGGMNFTEEEINHMIDSYNVMEEADQSMGVNAWAKLATEHPNHSAQEWHNYFVQLIKPLVQKRRQESESPLSEPSTEPIEAPISREKVVDPSTKDEKLFIQDLTAMAEENGIEVSLQPIIYGRKIPLFKLWQLVNSEEFGGYDEVEGRRLWVQVARKLNFNDFKHANAPEAVRSAYKEVLPDFEAMREEFLQEEEELIEQQLLASANRNNTMENLFDEEAAFVEEEEEEEDYDDDLEAPASVPRQPYPSSSSKRNLDYNRRINQDGSPILDSYNKRQRIDKGKGKEREIPSTPEDVINANQTPHRVYQSSPLKNQQTGDEEHGDGTSEELFMQPVKKQIFPTQRQVQRALEPETQDFNFNIASVDDDDAASQVSLPSLPSRFKARQPPTSSPYKDSSTQSQTASQIDEELMAFVDRHIALGYSQDVVIEALESTSMTTGNAAIIMEELSQGHGIPENIQGVWTALDDAALEDMETEDFERVALKHGPKFIAIRQKFLAHRQDARRSFERE